MLDAVAAHARLEAEIGGYEAERAIATDLDAGRALVGSFFGMGADEVAFVESAHAGLCALLNRWPHAAPPTVALTRTEYGPNVAAFIAAGYAVRFMPTDDSGRTDLAALPQWLRAEQPTLVHLTPVPSQRGLLQPARAISLLAKEFGLPVVADVAQAFGHVPLDFDANAVYGTSRKWLAGPRGVGFVAASRATAHRLRRIEGDDGDLPVRWLENQEGHVGGRLGFCLAVKEFSSAGAHRVHARLAGLGQQLRQLLNADLAGWRVLEVLDEPTAMVTLAAPSRIDVAAARTQLLQVHGILTNAVPPSRAPQDMTEPVLRISPHLDAQPAVFDRVVAALRSVT